LYYLTPFKLEENRI